ncbi:GGDEF domain-containing protein [Clostridium perfringens]|nr:GGDEF domain-containing protein [Clostridium perfringens]
MDIVLEIKNRLSIFKNFYDEVRIVDPIRKKLFSEDINEICNHNTITKAGFSKVNCYDIWGKDSGCENCVSKRAYIENDTFIKLEHNNGKVFLVIASPIEIQCKRYVVEILKDVTDNGEIVDRGEGTNYLNLNMGNIGENLVRDYLTGVYNRRYINQRLSKELKINLNSDIHTTVMMIDIDFFKSINDTYGHLVGDNILREFANILSKNVRVSSDWVGRYGGEEFIIVLNNADKEIGVNVAEKLRKIVENKEFIYDEAIIKITASFGVYEVLKGESISDIIKNADNKLYAAKALGRNKVVF